MTDQQYRNMEIVRAHREGELIAKSPISERKEGANLYHDALKSSPEIIAERVRWILNGDYGAGQAFIAREIINHPRMNQAAILALMVAMFEYRTDNRLARKAFNKLHPDEKAKVNALILAEIENYSNEVKNAEN